MRPLHAGVGPSQYLCEVCLPTRLGVFCPENLPGVYRLDFRPVGRLQQAPGENASSFQHFVQMHFGSTCDSRVYKPFSRFAFFTLRIWSLSAGRAVGRTGRQCVPGWFPEEQQGKVSRVFFST